MYLRRTAVLYRCQCLLPGLGHVCSSCIVSSHGWPLPDPHRLPALSTHEYIVREATMWRDSDEDRFTLVMYAFYMLRLLRYLQDMMVIKSWKLLMVPNPVLEHLRDTFMERSHNGW